MPHVLKPRHANCVQTLSQAQLAAGPMAAEMAPFLLKASMPKLLPFVVQNFGMHSNTVTKVSC